MTELTSPSCSVADALIQIVPVDTAQRLAGHLTAVDVATLRDLVRAAVPANTVRAVASDLAYLEAWSLASTGAYLAWPPNDAAALSFIAQHLFRATERAVRVEGYGMPADVEAALRAAGVLRGALPHAPATVARRLSSWRRAAEARGFEAALTSAAVRRALSAATKASTRQKGRHSQIAVTRKVLDTMLNAGLNAGLSPGLIHGLSLGLTNAGEEGSTLTLRQLRDRALLLVAFATGGRRRSELGALRIEHVFALGAPAPLPGEGRIGQAAKSGVGPSGEGLGIALGGTKSTTAQDGGFLVVTGRAQRHLEAWLSALRTVTCDGDEGPIFRPIDRWGNVAPGALSGEAVNRIVKRTAATAGIDPGTVSAHGLRAGYLTEASLRGVPIEAAMRHSLHRSVQSAVRYYRDQERASGKAAKLAG